MKIKHFIITFSVLDSLLLTLWKVGKDKLLINAIFEKATSFEAGETIADHLDRGPVNLTLSWPEILGFFIGSFIGALLLSFIILWVHKLIKGRF